MPSSSSTSKNASALAFKSGVTAQPPPLPLSLAPGLAGDCDPVGALTFTRTGGSGIALPNAAGPGLLLIGDTGGDWLGLLCVPLKLALTPG